MTELLKQLKASGNFMDAYLVAKNSFSRHNDDVDAFCDFIDQALEIAMYDIVFEERKQYANDANAALIIFSESVEMNEDILILLQETRGRINHVLQEILKAEESHYLEVNRQLQDENTTNMNQLVEIYEELSKCKTQAEFDATLEKVSDVEARLHKDVFSANQEKTYETLTKKYSQAISRKMEDLNKIELLEYNKKAVACFNEVFQAFKREPSRYKDESLLKALMVNKFFAFDTSKLMNESLVFYNHVYSLVFQESPDALKYKLTEWALDTIKLAK